MRIAADGYELGRGARGVGRVIQNFLRHLPGLLPEDDVFVYVREPAAPGRLPGLSESVLPRTGGYLRWLNGPLRRALRRDRPDVFIAANYVLPLFYGGPTVLMEHDISVVSHPEWYPRKYALSRRFLVGRSLARASAVVVPSDFTRREIQARFRVPDGKLSVIGYGVEDSFRRRPGAEVERWKGEKGLAGKRLVGFLGSIFRRRHVLELVRAVGRLRAELPDLAVHLVGENLGGLNRTECDEVRSLSWVRWDTTLAEADLPVYYSALDAFAYLSEYEGFGFPPLEALACGTPAVVLGRASLAEIFRDVAVTVETVAEDAVARGLRTALAGGSTRTGGRPDPAALRERFSWPKASAELAGLLSALKSGEGPS